MKPADFTRIVSVIHQGWPHGRPLPSIAVSVEGPPVQWSESHTRTGRRYTPHAQREQMAAIRSAAASVMRERPDWPMDAAYELVVQVYRKRKPTSRADGTNYLKLCEDALNGVCWADDARVVRGTVEKHQDAEERTVVWVRVVG